MSTSLQTANYGFGKYAPDDLTSYLTDYNRAMDKIDEAIKGVSDVANEAKATGDANLNNIANLTQGLTATNKNVENLGKTQTAQQNEIDNINASLATITIGDFQNVTIIHSHGTSNGKATMRSIGNGLQGCIDISIKSGTYTVDRTFGGETCIDLGYIAGNPFALSASAVVQRALAIGMNGSTIKSINNILVGYDTATNTTRVCIVVDSSGITFGADIDFRFNI